MVASPPCTSFFGTRLMAGFGGLSNEPVLVFKGFWTWGLSLSLDEVPALWVHLDTLVAFGGTGNFSSGMTLLHDINLFHQYLGPSGVDTTCDLGVLPLGVGITVAC